MGRRPTGISAKQTPADSRLAGVCLCCTNFTLPTGALDSKSSRYLLESMEMLNRELEATILMVTHDAFSASYATRVIFIKDGHVFSEIRKGADTRKQFFDKIIEVVTMLGGNLNDAL